MFKLKHHSWDLSATHLRYVLELALNSAPLKTCTNDHDPQLQQLQHEHEASLWSILERSNGLILNCHCLYPPSLLNPWVGLWSFSPWSSRLHPECGELPQGASLPCCLSSFQTKHYPFLLQDLCLLAMSSFSSFVVD